MDLSANLMPQCWFAARVCQEGRIEEGGQGRLERLWRTIGLSPQDSRQHASGLEGQRFRFVGYLPAEGNARRAAIAELERQSSRHAETQIFIETPYRNEALLADLLQACRGASRLAVAADLTGAAESIRMDRIDAWRARAEPIGKRPAIFLLQA